MRILIVEDQESLANLIKDGLESEGFSADCILTGETVLAQVMTANIKYDLILLDNMLPKKNGLEVCKSLRKEKIMIPIFMLTAKDNPSDIIKALEAGADDYLIKPFSFQVLLEKIRAITNQRRMLLEK